MNASVAIQLLPGVSDTGEMLHIVDAVIEHIKSSGLSCHIGPFETTIEGDFEKLMEIVKECQYIAVKAGSPSVMSYVKISYRPKGDLLTIQDKTQKFV